MKRGNCTDGPNVLKNTGRLTIALLPDVMYNTYVG